METTYFSSNYLFTFFITCVILNLSGSNTQSQGYTLKDTPCQTPEGAGRCVAIAACPTILTLIRLKPLPPDVSERIRKSQCGMQDNQPKVCCPIGIPDEPTANPVAVQQSSLLPDTSECGLASGARIFGGNITEIDDFPWMALLEQRTRNKFYCGGILISSRYILTAAHCVIDKGDPLIHRPTSVRLGEWNIETDTDCNDGLCSAPVVDVPVEKRIVHEKYNSKEKKRHHDIALIRLARKVSYTNWIKPICLPIFNQRLLDTSYIDDDMHVSGWGRTENGTLSKLKLQVRLPIVNQTFCQRTYQTQSIDLGVGQFCAGGVRGKDSCGGDSGGPIMFNDVYRGSANWYVYGIVSFGPNTCGRLGWPGVYTKVGAYGNWIMANIEP